MLMFYKFCKIIYFLIKILWHMLNVSKHYFLTDETISTCINFPDFNINMQYSTIKKQNM